MQKKATGEIDWDLEAIKGASSSWKDEWLNYSCFQHPTHPSVYSRNGTGSCSWLSHNSKLCQNGINILWGLSLLPHLVFVQLLNSLERSMTDGRTNKKILRWKILPRLMMLGMFRINLEVVEWFMTLEDPKSTSSTSKCGDIKNDRRICKILDANMSQRNEIRQI